jgi:lipopolysaccharide heptosyltransferase II
MDHLNKTLETSIDELLKDREALALRNKTLADAIHQTPLRHQIRRVLLRLLANTYIPPSRTAESTNRILLIRPDHLGDLLLTTPAMHALRAACPNTEIHALVGPWSAGLLENFDMLDLVLTINFPGFTRGRNTNWRSPYRYAIETARRLRRIGYAQAIIFRPDHWWGAWLANLTGIPRRIGYNHIDTALFLTDTVERQHEHAVQQNLKLVEALTQTPAANPTYSFPVTATDHAYVQGYLAEWNIEADDDLFCIHPGAGTHVKQWLPEKWSSVADILSEQLDAKAVFTGSDNELPMIRTITDQMERPAAIMAGDTEVSQLAALYKRAQVVLGPDSGPLHIAAAAGTPTVTLYGPADPVEFGPWGNPKQHIALTNDMPCRPCRILDWNHDDPRFHPCVRNITVSEVLSAARLAAANTT